MTSVAAAYSAPSLIVRDRNDLLRAGQPNARVDLDRAPTAAETRRPPCRAPDCFRRRGASCARRAPARTARIRRCASAPTARCRRSAAARCARARAAACVPREMPPARGWRAGCRRRRAPAGTGDRDRTGALAPCSRRHASTLLIAMSRATRRRPRPRARTGSACRRRVPRPARARRPCSSSASRRAIDLQLVDDAQAQLRRREPAPDAGKRGPDIAGETDRGIGHRMAQHAVRVVARDDERTATRRIAGFGRERRGDAVTDDFIGRVRLRRPWR